MKEISLKFCLLQNVALLFSVGLFAMLLWYMGNYEHQRTVFQHTYKPYPCLVQNISWEKPEVGNFTFLVDHQWEIIKNHVQCSDIDPMIAKCLNISFVGYFNNQTKILQLSNPFSLSLLPAIIMLGMAALIMLTILCTGTCSTNRFLWNQRHKRPYTMLA